MLAVPTLYGMRTWGFASRRLLKPPAILTWTKMAPLGQPICWSFCQPLVSPVIDEERHI